MPRVLVIDDNDEFRSMIKEFLQKTGYEVLTAGDGDKGIALQRREPADVIITDIIMPEKEGVETMIELRQEFPDIKISSKIKERPCNQN